jgi:hypothetical protein
MKSHWGRVAVRRFSTKGNSMQYPLVIGRVGALAVALGVGFAVGDGIASAQETGGTSTADSASPADSASSTDSSGSTGSATGGADPAGGTSGADPAGETTGQDDSGGASTSTQTQDHSADNTGDATGTTDDATTDAASSAPADSSTNGSGTATDPDPVEATSPAPNSEPPAAEPAEADESSDSDFDPSEATSVQSSTLETQLDGADQQSAANGSTESTPLNADAGAAAETLTDTTTSATAEGVTSADGAAPTTTDDLAATAEIAEAPQMVAAPETTEAQPAGVDMTADVLTAMGLNPSATDTPVPEAPPSPVELAALQWTRREAEQAALAEVPTTVAPTTTSLTVDPAASSDSSSTVAAVTTVDNTAELQAMFDALQPGDTLTLEPTTYNYSDNLYIRTSDVTIIGNGATLNSTNPDRSVVVIQANNVSLSDVNLTAPVGLPRNDGTDTSRLVFGGSGVHISDVSITGGASVGIYITGASNFQLDRVTVQDTAADGVQITNGSNNGTLNNVTTLRTGDDGIAIVTYQYPPGYPDLGIVRDITINNPVVNGSGQRGLVVVGGERITFNNINVSNTALQAVFIGTQAAFYTQESIDITVSGGIITNGGSGGLPSGAVAVYTDNPNQPVSNVTIENLTLVNTPATAYTNVALVSQGGTLSNITFRNIAIWQPVPTFPLPFFTMGALPGTYTATGFTVNGQPVNVTPVGVAV